MMHLLLEVEAAHLEERAARLAEEQGIWGFRDGSPCDDPGWIRVELSVGRATCQLTPPTWPSPGRPDASCDARVTALTGQRRYWERPRFTYCPWPLVPR